MRIPQIAVVCNWRNENNKSGLYSIYLRVTINRDSRYYKVPVPQKISLSQWTGKEDGWVKNHPFSFEINNKIIEKKNVVNELIKRSYNLNKPLSFDSVFKYLKKKGASHSFYEYMEEFIKNPPEKLEPNTIKKYQTCLAHLRGFKRELYFPDIDAALVKGFYHYMQKTLKLQGGSCKKYMEGFKRVVKAARKENYIDPSQMEFLFDDVKIKVETPKRTYLEISEIKQWKSLVFPADKKFLERDRDLFLFQIYTGYYYKDLLAFKKEQLVTDDEFGYFIVGARDKNGNQTLVPLFKFPYASAIVRKYQSQSSEKLIFDPTLFIEEQAYNRNLKTIAALAGIEKNMSNKVARHTNAQLWVRYGAERPIVSKMMGHTKEETTKNYFSINIPEIVEGTKRVDFKKLGI
ncbi:MAG: site-specific integrase [Chitinophagaceae bacterium]